MFRIGSVIGLVVGGLLGGWAASLMADKSELGWATVPFFAVFGASGGWMAGHAAYTTRSGGGTRGRVSDAEPGAAADTAAR